MENIFSGDIIGNTNISGNLQVIERATVEGVRFGHISPKHIFSCPIGHPTPNLPLIGCINLKSQQNIEKDGICLKTIFIMIFVIQIQL